jgi:uracil-DNA glycosylase family 4
MSSAGRASTQPTPTGAGEAPGEPHPPAARTAARLLRQRRELGAGRLFLEGMGSEEALRLAGAVILGSPVAGGAREKGALAQDHPAEESLPGEHEELRELCLGCTRCRLASGRTQVVFSDGNPAARVMVVGEAPGANEDATGLPFVGAAGKLLDLLLATVDLSRRDSVYICNVLKCRPPGNRNPLPDEIETCSPYLRAQIGVVRPEAILAVGTFAAQLLTGKELPLGRLRGEVHAFQGTPLVVTYHPAALLRNSGWTRATWDDLQLLRQVLERT